MDTASQLVLTSACPEAVRLWRRAVVAQGLPTRNRAGRRHTAKVIRARDRARPSARQQAHAVVLSGLLEEPQFGAATRR